jgi:hypothetical protein
MPQHMDWLTRPESLFRTLLWVLGPFFSWFIGRAILRRYEAWEAAQSESNARAMLAYLYKSLDNPPTLLESLAYIVCLLPIPFFIVALFLTLYFAPRPHWVPFSPLDPDTAYQVRRTTGLVLSLFCYTIFGVLTVHGIKTAYHLRHGQARYHANYRAGIQKRIEKLLKKFPQLQNDLSSRVAQP